MYNLTVNVAHTFFVGEDGWLVHNAGCRFDPASLQNEWANARAFKKWVKTIDYRRGIPPLNQTEADLIYKQALHYGTDNFNRPVVKVDTNPAGMSGTEFRNPGLRHFVVGTAHVKVEPGVTLP